MEYSKIIIINFILIISFINLLLLAITLFSGLVKRPSSIKTYYISNIFYTLICGIIYISFFIIFLYCLRIYNITKIVDLKIYFRYASVLKEFLIAHPFLFNIYLCFYIIIISVIISLILSLLHKYFISQIFNLYLFLRHNPIDRKHIISTFFRIIQEPLNDDVLSYYLQQSVLYLDARGFYWYKNLLWKNRFEFGSSEYLLYKKYRETRRWYYYRNLIIRIVTHRYYKKYFIPFSPILFLLYDCTFNNFILTHLCCYLLLYIPLMLWRRITTSLFYENTQICYLIWDILYEEELCIYALPLNHKKLLEIYIANGIKTIPIPGNTSLDLHASMYMEEVARFEYDVENNYYCNSENFEIYENIKDLLVDNMIKVAKWESSIDEKHYEEWYIIAIKLNQNE